ncbi:MAG: tRNA pseudouridine(38-40) synthase TruA [Clostridiales bacterium]|jgi:tRNA pseudouridine38-40 synthase|nr:tRNA pseudouridine(38-40) synthase TruA [Clostridiales bacterium]
MKYKITFAYKGTAYAGWQRQRNAVSVQEVLEAALGKLFGAPCSVTASGRTDAGVHAAGQVAHFNAETSIPHDKIPFAVNTLLPPDISVYACEIAPEDFNARFSAKRKTYSYSFYTSSHINPLKNDLASHIPYALDLKEMRRAAAFMEGTHDFKCFEAAGSIVKNTVRTLYSLTVSRTPPLYYPSPAEFGQKKSDAVKCYSSCGESAAYASAPHSPSMPEFGRENSCAGERPSSCGESAAYASAPHSPSLPEFGRKKYAGERPSSCGENDPCASAPSIRNLAGEDYQITVTGDGFLYNMVRIIAGTLVYVGMGKISSGDIPSVLLSRDRTRAGKTLPANGLTLVSVEY